MKTYDLEIRNTREINMSNWQITHTVNVLTTVNNKFDILNKLNKYINADINKKNIFVMDKSFSFNTNYRTYFSINNGDDKGYVDIDKLCNMGKIISMEPNNDLININIICDSFRKLNSILGTRLKCRLKKFFLYEAYENLNNVGIKGAVEILVERAKEQIEEVFERRLSPDYNEMNIILQSCDGFCKNNFLKIKKKYEELDKECSSKFDYYFNSCARPVLGLYNEKSRTFEIINADQMYKNGEESINQIKLNKITKNSPVLLAFTVVGTMGAIMGYLAYREHKVNTFVEDKDIIDIPSNRQEAISNILGNDDNSVSKYEGYKNNVDKRILNLATDTYSKAETVIDNKKVIIDYKMQAETKI